MKKIEEEKEGRENQKKSEEDRDRCWNLLTVHDTSRDKTYRSDRKRGDEGDGCFVTVPGPTKRIARLRGIFMPRPEISATRGREGRGGGNCQTITRISGRKERGGKIKISFLDGMHYRRELMDERLRFDDSSPDYFSLPHICMWYTRFTRDD